MESKKEWKELISEKSETKNNSQPKASLGSADLIALVVGIVIGAGIFRTPSLVAANAGSGTMMLSVWLLGGLVSLIGALCYAELTTTFPNTGGDYFFLKKSFGRRIAFLFAWARMSVIQSGSIALLSFIFGDYASQIYSLGEHSSVIYAGLVVIVLTGINVYGVTMGTGTQKILTTAEVLGIVSVIVVGFFFVPEITEVADANATNPGGIGAFGLSMVFVLLTFGGWNEAAYISAEMRSGPKKMAMALIMSIILITVVYLLVNMAYLRGLGLSGMAESEAVAGDLMQHAFGDTGLLIIAILVAVSALTSANATIFTGARSNFALGRDFPAFSKLGKWNTLTAGPVNAFIVQGIIALMLVSLGLFSRNGFETMVEFTAPVFWFFFLLVGISIFILRAKEPDKVRPFKVPGYPFTPLVFCFTSGYLLYSSIAYTGWGSLVGIGVLLAGLLLHSVLPAFPKSAASFRKK